MVLQSSVVSITSYLDGLTPQQRWALYESPWTCQAVFRSLPRLAQAYVLHLLLIDSPVQDGAPSDHGAGWVAAPPAHARRTRSIIQRPGTLTAAALVRLTQAVELCSATRAVGAWLLAEVVEAWCADPQRFGPQHRAALKKLFDLGLFLTHKE